MRKMKVTSVIIIMFVLTTMVETIVKPNVIIVTYLDTWSAIASSINVIITYLLVDSLKRASSWTMCNFNNVCNKVIWTNKHLWIRSLIWAHSQVVAVCNSNTREVRMTTLGTIHPSRQKTDEFPIAKWCSWTVIEWIDWCTWMCQRLIFNVYAWQWR